MYALSSRCIYFHFTIAGYARVAAEKAILQFLALVV